MARISAAVLCDFAQVREGLLFVSSGGVNRMWRPQTPAPLGFMLGIVLEIGPDEFDQVHSLSVVVKFVDTATPVLRVDGGVQVDDASIFEPGEAALLPAAIDLRAYQVTELGQYDVQLNIDGGEPFILSFWMKALPTK